MGNRTLSQSSGGALAVGVFCAEVLAVAWTLVGSWFPDALLWSLPASP